MTNLDHNKRLRRATVALAAFLAMTLAASEPPEFVATGGRAATQSSIIIGGGRRILPMHSLKADGLAQRFRADLSPAESYVSEVSPIECRACKFRAA